MKTAVFALSSAVTNSNEVVDIYHLTQIHLLMIQKPVVQSKHSLYNYSHHMSGSLQAPGNKSCYHVTYCRVNISLRRRSHMSSNWQVHVALAEHLNPMEPTLKDTIKAWLRLKMTEEKPAELIFICFMLLHGKAQEILTIRKRSEEDDLLKAYVVG